MDCKEMPTKATDQEIEGYQYHAQKKKKNLSELTDEKHRRFYKRIHWERKALPCKK